MSLLGAVVGGLVGAVAGVADPRVPLAAAAAGAALAIAMSVTGRRYTYVSRYGARARGAARQRARLFGVGLPGWLGGGLGGLGAPFGF